MRHRFFVPDVPEQSPEFSLHDESLVHQMVRVLRMHEGDECALFTGDGNEVVVHISEITKKEVRCVVHAWQEAWVPRRDIEIALACIRKERFEWALEKCTELGVSHVIPLTTERSERGVVARVRAERILKEASEQCGRGTVPSFEDVVSLRMCIAKKKQQGRKVYACTHRGAPYVMTHTTESVSETFLVGPEGGWSPNEYALFEQESVQEISLGHTNLRAETAAVAVCVIAHTTEE